jgi:hypothetical protein
MSSAIPARIYMESGIVVSGCGGMAQEIRRKIGPFVIHKELALGRARYCVTAPCGSTLGFYRRMREAVSAANTFSPLIKDPCASTLEGLFGTIEEARSAWDATRALRSH